MLVLTFLLSCVLYGGPAFASPQADAKAANNVTDLLRAKDQALLNAVTDGDRKVWDAALAPDAVYVDESGAIMHRAEFLEQITPLPAAISGKLAIASYSAQVDGDVALVIHTDDEVETFHGQELHAQYLSTETWRRSGDDWKLYMVHTYAVLKDPPSISLPAAQMQEYAGRYAGAPDLTYIIKWDGKQLTGGREGRELKPLQVEVRDVLFAPGQPRIRKIFQRDPSGKITQFVDRRESWDLVWRKVGP
jgi:hypothetical protein